MKKLYRIISLLLITTFMVVACSSNDPSTEIADEQDNEVVENNQVKEVKEEVENENSENEVKSKVLRDLMNAEEYTMEMRQTTSFKENESTSLVTTVVSGDDIYTYSEIEGMTMEFMEKEDKLYMIMHESKTVMTLNRYEYDETENTNISIVYDDLEYLSKGTEMFLGNNRPYEEYKIDSGIAKYYFDGEKLDGLIVALDMESLLEDDDDDEDEIVTGEAIITTEVLSYEETIDKSVFDLPEDYEIVGN